MRGHVYPRNFILWPLQVANVLAVNVVAVDTAVSLQRASAFLCQVDDGATSRGDGARGGGGRVVGKGDLAESSQVVGKVLDDPLGVSLAERRRGALEGVRRLLASGQVLENGDARRLGRGVDLHVDLVADAEGKVVKHDDVVGDPLPPGVEAAVAVKVNARLQERGLAAVAVDAHPGGAGLVGAAAPGRRHLDGADNLGDALGVLDGAGPVG